MVVACQISVPNLVSIWDPGGLPHPFAALHWFLINSNTTTELARTGKYLTVVCVCVRHCVFAYVERGSRTVAIWLDWAGGAMLLHLLVLLLLMGPSRHWQYKQNNKIQSHLTDHLVGSLQGGPVKAPWQRA